MNRILLAAATVFVVSFWLATSWAATAQSGAEFALEVILMNNSGTPIPNATVLLQGAPFWEGRTAFTQDEGQCTFAGLHEANYRIAVSAPGFVSTAYEDHFVANETIRIVLLPRSQAAEQLPASSVSLNDLAAPPEAEAAYRRGLRSQNKGQHKEGRRAFLAAIDIYPAYPAAYAGLGISLLQLGEREEALKALRQALELNPSSYDAQLCAGLILNDQRRFFEAQDHLHAAAKLNSRDWQVHYELGRMLYGLNRFAEAEQSLRVARRSQPPYGNLYLLLANTLTWQEKHEEAILEFEEFLEVVPKGPAADEVREKLRLLRAEVESRKSQGVSQRSGQSHPPGS